MQLADRIALLARLGDYLRSKDERLEAVIHRTSFTNLWFTKENQWKAVEAIAEQWLRSEKLEQWLSRYEIPPETDAKKVGLVLAGNIPLVGFHDVVSVFATGHKAVIKLSEKDPYLLPFLVKVITEMDGRAAPYFRFVDRLEGFDAVIATGSNNSSRYFEAYFGKYPHIIRKNRNGIAILTGAETPEELAALGEDIFRYFGLGCRNVSKLYVPEGYDFEPLMETLHEYRQIVLHDKYRNNFDYNTAIAMLNKTAYLSNGCLVLMEDPGIVSPIAAAYYQFYSDIETVEKEILERSEEIQLVTARPGVLSSPTLPFGTAQEPALWDYADGVDTVAFLLGCNSGGNLKLPPE
ncbi:MAG TPA: acyl-CoA reductase [Flavilitoribacter sp.]|nr:acyl-CoA reductase [Flavilitoribacter sp.]HMQ86923.1 acyl-CoA reductase [Flavilitoribacter sp.]